MKPMKTARVLAALLMGIIFGAYRHFQQMRWLVRGKDAYLADASLRFDRFAHYHTGGAMLVAGVLLAGMAVATYEAIVAGFAAMLPASRAEE